MEWCHPQTRMRPRRPWGLRTAELSPLSWAPRGPSGEVSYAKEKEASPSLGAANGGDVAAFLGSRVAKRGGVIRRPE